MSTDDSISEDVSSLSHCHADANGEGGKESESSEGTSAASGLGLGLGLAGLEERKSTSKTAGGAVDGRAYDMTPACSLPQKIRSLCLSTEEAFGSGKCLPFINPSSLETLRALVQEIQSSGETDPEMWKDCEGRWLHLFQLVEKQYQEQILAQQEQYQCQIQLIQDEIKALVQLQNRQTSTQTHHDYPYSPTATTNTQTNHDYPSTLSTITQTHPDYTSSPVVTTKDYPSPPTSNPNHPSTCTDLPNGNSPLSAPPTSLFVPQPILSSTSPQPPPPRPGLVTPGERCADGAGTELCSGYGTLSAWGTRLEGTVTPGGAEETGQVEEEPSWSLHLQDDTEITLIGQKGQQRSASANEVALRANPSPPPEQQRTSSQPLTSWAQKQRRSKPKKSRAGQAQHPQASPSPLQAPSLGQSDPQTSSPQEQQPSSGKSPRDSPLDNTDLQDQHGWAAPSTNSFPLRRSDSLMSEVSGLTYWRLDESELYCPLPDSFDSGAYLLLQEASISLTSPEEQKLSLREIYHNKQRTESKRTNWDLSRTCSPTSPQVLTLDPTVHLRQSDRTSGFTSPSHFSSPSYPTLPHLYPRVGIPCTPVSPDGMSEGSANPGDTDCPSNASSLSATAPTPARVASAQIKLAPSSPSTSKPLVLPSSQQRKALATQASEDEGSNTHTSNLMKLAVSGKHTHSHTLSRGNPRMEKAASLEDPVVVSLLRENLREKHCRHVADLKAYYEAEIKLLRDKLDLRDLPHDLEQSNRTLRQRCAQLERALSEASSRIQELESNNSILEKQLADWPARYDTACSTATSLQQRLDESRRSVREKDASAGHLRTRVRQLEEALENTCRETQEKEARTEREYKMLQDLLGEYDSLRKEHEGVKDSLVSAENKLFDANEQISRLKRVICKMESQVNQLDYVNQARNRQAVHNHTQSSGAGLYHHPDLLLSPSKHPRQPESTYRISPCPQTDQSHSARKSPHPQTDQSQSYRMSPCPQTDQLGSYRKSPCPQTDQSGNSVHTGSRRCSCPPESEQPQNQGGGLREARGPLTPLMRALIELDETRTTEGRAPWLGSRRPTVGFIERNHREPQTQDRARAMEDVAGLETGMSGTVRGVSLLRAQRSLSPEGHRSSSLPPRTQRTTFPPTTPTKRETLMMPLSAKSSPKRCPAENYSTAFGNPPPRQQLHNRFDVALDQRRHSFHNSSPRKRLFPEASQRSSGGSVESSGSVDPQEGVFGLGWQEQGTGGGSCSDLQDPGTDLQTRLHSLADAERMLDELTMEKQQIESALSRMPGSGGRVSLQTRLDEVALENRLERVNRDLGSIRMTLKRFHVLRSSAKI
ncbi:M-phase phosphoprotein 9 isoform X2 [Salmo salar]|uniref:M-phase phosphoprotein 9 isoform X2 n=1 Tax=Salmo salar TaxID=8030 RepID=A0A1S3LSN4_SALSA|nr:M-phase phosphoprotein 9 isoform X2 [Salmo salar]|eukprot:XP_013993945.1 PREDICTED: M-phase phosphoprotein 9-like isoform X2 [Salmo salar]